jgi:nucleoside-diphosphate-sugar epimerase
VDGTLNILLAARKAGVKRVIYASSSALYGDSPELPKREGMWVLPSSPYGVAKYTAEMYCRVFHICYGIETVCLRYFNVFGPRQSPSSVYAGVMPIFITMLLAGKKPTIDGDGEQTRDFTYVDDIVQANMLALAAPDAVGRTMNIATGKQISVNQLYQEIDAILKTGIEPEHGPPRPGDIKHSVADISLARKLLGYEPKVPYAEGLAKTIDWSRENLI